MPISTEHEGEQKFVIVKPKARTIETVSDVDLPLRRADLDPMKVDFGSIGRLLGFVVYEYSLFVPPAEQSYFGIAGKLIAGNAVFFGVGETGETVDLMKSQLPDIRFYLGANDVEAAIASGEIMRPQMSQGGHVFWRWPQPRPRETIF